MTATTGGFVANMFAFRCVNPHFVSLFRPPLFMPADLSDGNDWMCVGLRAFFACHTHKFRRLSPLTESASWRSASRWAS